MCLDKQLILYEILNFLVVVIYIIVILLEYVLKILYHKLSLWDVKIKLMKNKK